VDNRLPAHLEVNALIRRVNSAGGFAMVMAKGEADAGTIMVILCHNGGNSDIYERMPNLEGARIWEFAQRFSREQAPELAQFLEKRRKFDSDLWIVELDIADGERFVG
jgi:hypothetical protein